MSTRRIRTFTVLPNLPERLRPLQKIAYNVWWSWNSDAISLFRQIDEDLFESLDNSPIKLLNTVSQARYEQLLQDDAFLAHLDRVAENLERYLASPTWFSELTSGGTRKGDRASPAPALELKNLRIAYFSAEFGLHDSIPVYSGGLGVLAGDHLKSASDLGIPLMGVGLTYRLGYFRQYLNADGWQQERYPENDFFNLPIIPEVDKDGKPVTVSVTYPGRDVRARVWRIQVGRVPLYLLDANVPQNAAEDREITGQLYGGDQEMRIKQELMLGVGGFRALRALGLEPTVCHMNEGHSAFLALERIRILVQEQGLTFDEAREVVTAGNAFTTHTPVPAGNDVFPPNLIEHYLGYYLQELKIDKNVLLGLGRQNPSDHGELFGMTVLALKLANTSNGVSKLHGEVSRKMWQKLWPDLPEVEVPITSITNGTHVQSWVAPELGQLFDRYLGSQWRDRPQEAAIWRRVENVPDAELWSTHERRRERMVAFARKRLRAQLKRRNAAAAELSRAEEALDPDALTIGFARRFATYKRGTLLFRNLERLNQLINSKERPVQIIYAGKAHPKDHGGKELIAEIVHVARRPEFRRRIVFIEDYDMNVARYLVQGVDVWLNNPRRPLEASGTSGMKAAANGNLNLSILDGWWCEGYAQDNGWAIGAGEEYGDLQVQDDVESRALYDLLEQEIVPAFYNRGSDGVPRGWLRMMKRCLITLPGYFNTHRMLQEYLHVAYAPGHRRFTRLMEGRHEQARSLAAWRKNLEKSWSQIRVEQVDAQGVDAASVGQELRISARVRLGTLRPDDVVVQLFHGHVDSLGEIPSPAAIAMSPNGATEGGVHQFTGAIPCRSSGQHGYAVRVLPNHPCMGNPLALGMVCWG